MVEPLPVTGQPPRKRWTRDECEKLEMYGLLETHRYELIEGDLIDKMGKNQPQVNARRLLVFREPREGEYQAISTYQAHEPVNPLAAPEAQLRINDILPAEN